jgi:hypothetical protein
MTEWDDMIDDDLAGKLSAAEALAFAQRRLEDPALAAEYAFRKEVRDALLQQEGAALRARMRGIVQAGAPNRRIPWAWIGVAAGICLLVALAMLWPRSQERLSAQQLFAAHLQAEPVFDLVRSPDDSRTARTRALATAYSQGEFQTVVDLLAMIPDSLQNLDDLYLKSVSLAQVNQDSAALDVVDEILMAGSIAYTEQTLRLEVLLLIRLGQLQQARVQIAALESVTSPHFAADTKAIRAWLEDAGEEECQDCK